MPLTIRAPDDEICIFTELFSSSFWYNKNKFHKGVLEATEWNSKNYFKWISRLWPAIMIKKDLLVDVVLGLNGIDWKKYFFFNICGRLVIKQFFWGGTYCNNIFFVQMKFTCSTRVCVGSEWLQALNGYRLTMFGSFFSQPIKNI